MSEFNLNIIATGSSGNCVVLDQHLMFDCGISKKHVIESGYDLDDLKVLFITHRHSDHTNIPFIRYCLKRGLEVHLPQAVVDELRLEGKSDQEMLNHVIVNETLGVFHYHLNVDGQDYDYTITPHPTDHYDLVNFAFEIQRSDGQSALYATDLRTVNPDEKARGIAHLGKFDLLMLEGNYDEVWLRQYIDSNLLALDDSWDPSDLTDEKLNDWIRANRHKIPHPISSSLFRAVQNMRHLSKQQARLYAAQHLKPHGKYYEMHRSSMFYEKPDNWKKLMLS